MLVSWGVLTDGYSDRHTIFFSPAAGKLTEEDELMGPKAPLTQYGTSRDQVHRGADSAGQGTNRGLWGTLQSRLVVEMRLRGIRTIDEANAFFPAFLKECHNGRFVVAAKETETAFLPCPEPEKFALVLATKAERIATARSEISWEGKKYSLVDSPGRTLPLWRGETITMVHSMMTEDSGIRAIRAIRNNEMHSMEFFSSNLPPFPAVAPELRKDETASSPKPHRSANNHPWR